MCGEGEGIYFDCIRAFIFRLALFGWGKEAKEKWEDRKNKNIKEILVFIICVWLEVER